MYRDSDLFNGKEVQLTALHSHFMGTRRMSDAEESGVVEKTVKCLIILTSIFQGHQFLLFTDTQIHFL